MFAHVFNHVATILRKAWRSNKGMASLPVVLTLASLTVVVSVSMVVVSYSETLTQSVLQESHQAALYAQSGARDALVRITKNREYTCATEDCYNIGMTDNGCDNDFGCAYVSVSAGVGTSGDPKVITSKGILKNITRTLRVEVVFDESQYGKITTTTWSEVY